MVLCNADLIQLEHLPTKLTRDSHSSAPVILHTNNKRDELITLLKETDGNQSKVAKILGVSRVTIWKRIKKFNIHLSSIIV